MNKIMEDPGRRTSKGAIFGLIMIVIGIALIANQFDIIPDNWHNLIFRWQTILIVLGVIFVTTRENRVTGYILMGIGGFFLLPELIDVPWEYRRMFWPIVFIIGGLIIIFKGTGMLRSRRISGAANDEDIIDDVNIFGGGDRQITSQNFKGGSIVSVFGGGKYDFRQAKLGKEKCIIDMVNIFGGANLIVPSDWNVKSEITGIFGGFSDKRHIVQPDTTKTLIVKGVSIFGGGDLKNV